MDKKLVEAIAQAAWDSREHLRNHLRRNALDAPAKIALKGEKNRAHIHIEHFQDSVEECLTKKFGNYNWTPEKKSDASVEDRVDIMGECNGRKCIIEIDAVRHDQIAPKFVSRIALWGLLSEPIDYVILLYDSTQESGKHNAEKFVRYTYAILKAINKDSSLIGLYVHTPKKQDDEGNYNDSFEYWDCEKQGFRIKGISKTHQKMIECAKASIIHFLDQKKNSKITYEDLRNTFILSERMGSSYISDSPGKSRAKPIGRQIGDHDIHIYTQFRKTGNQHNWDKFVKICKDNGIVIEQSYIQGKYAPVTD